MHVGGRLQMSDFHAVALRQIRKETRQRRLYGACAARRGRLRAERRVLRELTREAQHRVLHYQYLSGQLREERRLVELELVYRSEVIGDLRRAHHSSSRLCIPHPTYDFELLRAIFRTSSQAWVGTMSYFRCMLVSKHFRDVVRGLCPTDRRRQTCALRIGDVVSSLALTDSGPKRSRMHNQLGARVDADHHMAKWQRSQVHKFRVIAKPAELKSLYAHRSCKWLLVPDLPWHLLFKLFAVGTAGSFLARLRRLKRVLMRYAAFRVTTREAMWKFGKH